MTYEEISTKYPIGKLLAKELVYVKRTGYWCGQADQEYYLTNYTQVHFYDTGYVDYTEKSVKEYRVRGGGSVPKKASLLLKMVGTVGNLLTKTSLMKLKQKAYYMNFDLPD